MEYNNHIQEMNAIAYVSLDIVYLVRQINISSGNCDLIWWKLFKLLKNFLLELISTLYSPYWHRSVPSSCLKVRATFQFSAILLIMLIVLC